MKIYGFEVLELVWSLPFDVVTNGALQSDEALLGVWWQADSHLGSGAGRNPSGSPDPSDLGCSCSPGAFECLWFSPNVHVGAVCSCVGLGSVLDVHPEPVPPFLRKRKIPFHSVFCLWCLLCPDTESCWCPAKESCW